MSFKKIDLTAIKQMYEGMKSSSNSSQTEFRWASLPEKGESIKVRFLPPVGSMEFPFFRVFKHYQVPSPGKEGTVNFTCLRTWNMECPICRKIEELKKKFGDELISQWVPSMRGFFNVLIKDDPNYVSGIPYILGLPKSGIVWFLGVISDDDYGDITDPYTGFWVKISRKDNNQLQFDIIPKPSPIADSEEKLNEIAENCFDLTKIWRNPDDEYLLSANQIANKIELLVKEKVGLLEVSNKVEPKIEITESSKVELPSLQKPSGAPECFGNYKESDTRCLICVYEVECRQASKGG